MNREPLLAWIAVAVLAALLLWSAWGLWSGELLLPAGRWQ